MPNQYNDFPDLPRIKQVNEFYCGPATLEMLCGFWGVNFSQDDFVSAANIYHKIEDHGMLMEEMAQAMRNLTTDLKFYFKRNATLAELSTAVNQYQVPVGVEWQGDFNSGVAEHFLDEEDEDEDGDDDPGHYSIVTRVDTMNNKIVLADPYRYFAFKDRTFKILQFERRWWDVNLVIDPITHRQKEISDYHAMYLVVPAQENFPLNLGMTSI